MSFVDVIDWCLGLFPRFFNFLNGMILVDGVSILSFIIAIMIISLLIYSFIPRP